MSDNIKIPVPTGGPRCGLCEARAAAPGSDCCMFCSDILDEQSVCKCNLDVVTVMVEGRADVRVVHEPGCFYRSKSGVPLLPKNTSARRQMPRPPC